MTQRASWMRFEALGRWGVQPAEQEKSSATLVERMAALSSVVPFSSGAHGDYDALPNIMLHPLPRCSKGR
jgi:hypothetical protein